MAVLADCEFENKAQIIATGKQFIKVKADTEGGMANWGGGISDTSYIVIHITESPLASDTELARLAGEATKWLEAKMVKKGHWKSEFPPYGGEVTSEDYFTSLALRALHIRVWRLPFSQWR